MKSDKAAHSHEETNRLQPPTGESVERQLKRGIKGTAMVFSGAVVGQVLGYAIRVVIARSLGPDVFGMVGLGSAVMAIGLSVAVVGLPRGVPRFISLHTAAGEDEAAKRVFIVAFIFTFLSSTLISTALFFSSHWMAQSFFHSSELVPFLQVFAVTMLFAAISRLLMGVLRGFERIREMVITGTFVPQTAILVGVFVLLGFQAAGHEICYAYTVGYVLSCLAAIWVLKQHIQPIPSLTQGIAEYAFQARKLLLFSWPLLFSTVLHQLRFSTDRILLGYFADAAHVGIYMAATPLVRLLVTITGAFGGPLLPMLTRYHRLNAKKEMKHLFRANNRIIFYISLPLLLYAAVFPEGIIRLLFGAQYVAGAQALMILALGILCYNLSGVSGTLITAVGRPKIILLAEFSSFLANVVLNILLIPRYGVNGAAAATAVSFALFGFILIAYGRIKLHAWVCDIKWLKYFFWVTVPFLASTMALVHVLPRDQTVSLLPGALLMAICVFAGLRITGLEPEETSILKAFKGRLGLS